MGEGGSVRTALMNGEDGAEFLITQSVPDAQVALWPCDWGIRYNKKCFLEIFIFAEIHFKLYCAGLGVSLLP